MPQAAGAGLAALVGAAEGTAYYYAAYAVGYAATTYALTRAVQAITTPGNNGANRSIMGGVQVQAGAVAGGAALSTSIPASDSPRRVVYGRVKVGGVPVYVTQTDSGRYVNMAIYISEGPISGVDSTIYIGDETSDQEQFAGLIGLNVFTGAAGQTYSAALAAESRGEWTSAMVGHGVAWAHVTYQFDPNAFSRGLIFPAFLVDGCPLYDPRTGLENGRRDNPALVLLHFIRSRWAFKDRLLDADIDFDAFAAAASICDEIVGSVDAGYSVGGVAGRVYRYSFAGVFEATGNPSQFVEAVCQSMAGHLINDGVQVRCYAGAWYPPTGPTLTAEYLREAPTFRTHPGGQQRYNIARGTYREPRQGWEMTDYAEQRMPAEVIAADGEIVSPLDLPGVLLGPQAQRLAWIAMQTARSAVPLVLRCNYAAFQWQLFDTVTVNLPEVGASGVFRIVQYDWAGVDDGGGIDITLVPHLASDYGWNPVLQEKLVPSLSRPTFRSLPAAITSLSLTGQVVYAYTDNVRRIMTAEWEADDWVMLSYYEVRFHKVGEDWDTYQTSDPRLVVENAETDVDYEIDVRAVGVDGRTGDWHGVVTGRLAPDTTGPSAPTGLSVTGPYAHEVSWTNPTDPDLSFVQVCIVGGPGLEGAVAIWEAYGKPGRIMSATFGREAGTHYAVRGVDISGNYGDLAYAGEGTVDVAEVFTPEFNSISASLTSLDGRVSALESSPEA